MDQDIKNKDFLEKVDIDELSKTREGRNEIFFYIMRERISFMLAELLVQFGIDLPNKEKQVELVDRCFQILCRVPVWELFDKQEEAKILLEKYKYSCSTNMLTNTDIVGEC